MLWRRNYYQMKKKEIDHVVFQMMDDLLSMMDQCLAFLDARSDHTKSFLLETENNVDDREQEIESTILDLISVQQLDVAEIKWLFMMNRIIRDLERVGDQITNVMTVSSATEKGKIKPLVTRFFMHEKQMIQWLWHGMESRQVEPMKRIRDRDNQVNQLNRETYDQLIRLMEEQKIDVEVGSKMIVVSRFLERVGDHLVNAAEMMEKYFEAMYGEKT